MKMNETRNTVAISTCPAGSKHFWCVVDSRTNDVIAHGRKPTLEEAEEQAKSQAELLRPGHATEECTESLAISVRRQLWKADCQPLGTFVYIYRSKMDGVTESIAYPIVRETKNYIFVRHEKCVYRLERKELDRYGYFYVSNAGLTFRKLPYEVWLAAEKAKSQRLKETIAALRAAGLSAFSDQERREAMDQLRDWCDTITDESVLERCIRFRTAALV